MGLWFCLVYLQRGQNCRTWDCGPVWFIYRGQNCRTCSGHCCPVWHWRSSACASNSRHELLPAAPSALGNGGGGVGVCACVGGGRGNMFWTEFRGTVHFIGYLFVCLFVYEPFILPHGDACRGEKGLFSPRNTLCLRFRGSVTVSWRRKIGRWWDGSKGQ